MRILLFLLVPVFLSADQVVLMNGDTITGSIVKKDGDKLTIKSQFLGEVTMPWSAVKSLRSDTPVTVVPATGASVQGKVETSGNDLQVATANGTQTMPLANVTAVRDDAEQAAHERLLHPGLLDLWTGNFNVGLALARGNAYTDTLTTAFNSTRTTRTNTVNVHLDQIFGSARIDGIKSTNANAIRGGWSLEQNLNPKLFANVLNNYEHDQFQSLDLRFVLGGGAGWRAVKTARTQFSVTAGVDYERENFTTLDRDSAEGNFGDIFTYKLSGLTTLNQSFTYFANLTDTGQYRFDFNLSSVTTLRKWLSLQFSGTDHFLSNPILGRQRNDLILSSGFRVSFGQQ